MVFYNTTHTQSKYLLIFDLAYSTEQGACSGVLLSIPIIDQFIFYRYTGNDILMYLDLKFATLMMFRDNWINKHK